MERQVITGIAYDKDEARVTLTGIADRPGAAAAIFGALAGAGVNYDMIVQSVPKAGKPADITFTVPAAGLAHCTDVLEARKAEIGFAELIADTDICKVSIVGVGIRSNPEIAARMFATLAERRIDILAIATSEIKVSVLIPEEYTELAVRVLHTAYGLDAEVSE